MAVAKLPPGPSAAGAKVVSERRKGGTSAAAPTNLPVAPGGIGDALALRLPGGAQLNPLAALPGGAPLISSQQGAAGGVKGYHLDKKTQSKWVKNRRMTPLNARALRRAIRRESGAIHLFKRAVRGTGITVSRHRIGAAKKKR